MKTDNNNKIIIIVFSVILFILGAGVAVALVFALKSPTPAPPARLAESAEYNLNNSQLLDSNLTLYATFGDNTHQPLKQEMTYPLHPSPQTPLELNTRYTFNPKTVMSIKYDHAEAILPDGNTHLASDFRDSKGTLRPTTKIVIKGENKEGHIPYNSDLPARGGNAGTSLKFLWTDERKWRVHAKSVLNWRFQEIENKYLWNTWIEDESGFSN